MFFLAPSPNEFLLVRRATREMILLTKSNFVTFANSSRLRWQKVRKACRSGLSQCAAMYDSPRPMSPRARMASTAAHSLTTIVAFSPLSLPAKWCVAPSGVTSVSSPKRVFSRARRRMSCLATRGGSIPPQRHIANRRQHRARRALLTHRRLRELDEHRVRDVRVRLPRADDEIHDRGFERREARVVRGVLRDRSAHDRTVARLERHAGVRVRVRRVRPVRGSERRGGE